MQRQKSMVGGGKRGSAVEPVYQSVSVMETLNVHALNRFGSQEILESLNDENLGESHSKFDYMDSLAGTLVTNRFAVTRQEKNDFVANYSSTKFSRMNFFHRAAEHGLTLPLSTDEASKIARVRAIEALLAAAYFGSGKACQRLLEQNEQGVIALTAQEIQQLVEAQIFWYEKAFGRYNAETNHHDYSNIDAQLQDYQTLPALLTNKKAWDAVRANSELFANVLRVAYHSGRAIQELLDADQKGTVVNLTNGERRELVQRQINQYFAAKLDGATIKVEDQQTPLLTIDSKVWHALMETPKGSWLSLLQFLKDLDAELPEHFRITNQDALAAWTEANPMAFKAYFENSEAQALVLVTNLDAKTRNHIETRNRVMSALAGLRHAAFKPDNRALLNMRPAIATKKEANEQADALAAREIFNEAARLAELDAEDLKTTPNPKETVLFIGEGVEKKGFGITSSMRNAVDRTIGELTKCTRVKHNEKGSAPKYIARLAAAEMLYAGQSDLVTDANRAEVNAKVAAIKAKQAEDNLGIDTEGSYLSRKAARDQRLQDFKNTKDEQKAVREAELEQMIANEQAFNATLVENNPIINFVRLVCLVLVQDLAIFGTLTQDWLMILSHALGEDLRAILAGEFAYEFTAGTSFSSEKSKEKFPLHMLVNDLSYVALIEIYRSAPRSFLMNIQDDFYNNEGKVRNPDIVQLLKGEVFPLHSGRNEVESAHIMKVLTRYAVPKSNYLSKLVETNMLLKLFISRQQVFPNNNADYSVVISERNKSCARITKIVNTPFAGMPSRLRNYLETDLVLMQDKQALKRLLTFDNLNALYGILLDKGVIRQGDYRCGMSERTQDAVKDIIDEEAITTMVLNKSYMFLEFLVSVIPQNAEVDFLVRVRSHRYLVALFKKGKADRLKVTQPEKMTEYQAIAETAESMYLGANNQHRSSFVEGTSPVRRASSALFEPKTRTPSPEGDTLESAAVIPVTASPVEVVSDLKAEPKQVELSSSPAVNHSTLAPAASAVVTTEVVLEKAEERKKVAPPPPPPPPRRDSAPAVSADKGESTNGVQVHNPVQEAQLTSAAVERNPSVYHQRASLFESINKLRTDDGRKTERPVSIIVKKHQAESKAKRSTSLLAMGFSNIRNGVVGKDGDRLEDDGYTSPGSDDEFEVTDNGVQGTSGFSEGQAVNPSHPKVTASSVEVVSDFKAEPKQVELSSSPAVNHSTLSPAASAVVTTEVVLEKAEERKKVAPPPPPPPPALPSLTWVFVKEREGYATSESAAPRYMVETVKGKKPVEGSYLWCSEGLKDSGEIQAAKELADEFIAQKLAEESQAAVVATKLSANEGESTNAGQVHNPAQVVQSTSAASVPPPPPSAVAATNLSASATNEDRSQRRIQRASMRIQKEMIDTLGLGSEQAQQQAEELIKFAVQNSLNPRQAANSVIQTLTKVSEQGQSALISPSSLSLKASGSEESSADHEPDSSNEVVVGVLRKRPSVAQQAAPGAGDAPVGMLQMLQQSMMRRNSVLSGAEDLESKSRARLVFREKQIKDSENLEALQTLIASFQSEQTKLENSWEDNSDTEDEFQENERKSKIEDLKKIIPRARLMKVAWEETGEKPDFSQITTDPVQKQEAGIQEASRTIGISKSVLTLFSQEGQERRDKGLKMFQAAGAAVNK